MYLYIPTFEFLTFFCSNCICCTETRSTIFYSRRGGSPPKGINLQIFNVLWISNFTKNCRLQSCHLMWRRAINVFLKGHSRPLFLYFRLFNTVYRKHMFHINFADDWIWTMGLWYCKRPLYQLSHNRCPCTVWQHPGLVQKIIEKFLL